VAQEEPQNMGAWRAIRHRLEESIAGRVRFATSAARGGQSSEGYPTAHVREQDRIVEKSSSAFR
jgi:2-oxoglutarate dehydrogenase complex dehydrogenase (E1) component-like enzyme